MLPKRNIILFCNAIVRLFSTVGYFFCVHVYHTSLVCTTVQGTSCSDNLYDRLWPPLFNAVSYFLLFLLPCMTHSLRTSVTRCLQPSLYTNPPQYDPLCKTLKKTYFTIRCLTWTASSLQQNEQKIQ